MSCRFYLPTIAPILRYLKTLSLDGIPIFLAIRNRCIVVCASRLPRRLPPRFSRRFPVSLSLRRPSRLPTVRAAIREQSSRYRACDAVPVCHVLVRCRVRPCISPPVAVSSDSAHIASPSMPPARPDIAAARPSRRMAPRWARRENQICPIGEDRHGSRWRPPDMPDAIHDARSRRSSGQRIPDTDIEAREAGGMRYACRDLYRLRYRALRHIAFSAENTFRAISTRSQRGVSYARDGYGSPARIGITVGASPMAARHVSADSGAARGRGENRMSLEDTWHVAR